MIISFKAVSVLVLAAVTTASVAQTPARSTDVAKGDDAPSMDSRAAWRNSHGMIRRSIRFSPSGAANHIPEFTPYVVDVLDS